MALAAEIQRNSIPVPDPSFFKDFPVCEECEAYKIFKEKSSIANTRAHMERESWGFVGGKRPGDTRTAEYMKQIPSKFSYHRYRTGPEFDHYAGIQNSTDISKIISEDSVRNPLLLDHAVQPGLAKTYAGIQNPTAKAKFIGEDSVRSTLLRDLAVQPLPAYAILFPNLINVNLPICKRLKDVVSATFRTLRNALKEVRSKKFRGPNIVSNGLSLFKSASKLAVGMVIIGNTPAVGAARTIAPEAVEPGSMQAEDFEKSSNFAFGVVACVGTLVAIIAFVKSVNCKRRHSIAGTSTASAPTGTILNRVGNMGQTLTVLRSWRETEFREVVVAHREEEGAYAS